MSAATHVLVIDPNDVDRHYFAQRLRKSLPDCVILEAATGQAGLDLYRTQSIDCVILEITLPDMSGFEALVKLVPIADQPEIPVIVLTQLDHTGLLDLAVKNGAFKALQKIGTSGDLLSQMIVRAMAMVPRQKPKDLDSQQVPKGLS